MLKQGDQLRSNFDQPFAANFAESELALDCPEMDVRPWRECGPRAHLAQPTLPTEPPYSSRPETRASECVWSEVEIRRWRE